MRARFLASMAALCLLAASFVAHAQQGEPQQAAAKPLTQAQLEQLVAPIALYPDALLAQVLMATTYPIEVVEAERFLQQNKGMTGAQLTQAAASQNWDASVKALLSTPSVLNMMNAKLDWTQSLGNAVVAQQAQVMAAVQALRQKAQAAGNLKSTPQQNVVAEAGQGQGSSITIEPAQPEIVYVPYYDPAVVYGVWAYPAYPPYIFPAPVGWVAGPGLWFGAGFALGVGWDHWGNWGAFNWHNGNIYVHGNVDNHWTVDDNRRVNVNNVNVNVDKSIDNSVKSLDDDGRADDNRGDDAGRADDDDRADDSRVDDGRAGDDDVSKDLNRDLQRDDDLGRDGGFGRDGGGDFGGFGRGGGGRR